MKELKTILEENQDLIRASKSLEELCAALAEKGYEVSVKELEALSKKGPVTALEDDMLTDVAGGISPLSTLFLLGSGLRGENKNRAVTLEHNSGMSAYATTLEQRSEMPAYATTLEERTTGTKKRKSALL